MISRMKQIFADVPKTLEELNKNFKLIKSRKACYICAFQNKKTKGCRAHASGISVHCTRKGFWTAWVKKTKKKIAKKPKNKL
jgi:hypothetical protein